MENVFKMQIDSRHQELTAMGKIESDKEIIMFFFPFWASPDLSSGFTSPIR